MSILPQKNIFTISDRFSQKVESPERSSTEDLKKSTRSQCLQKIVNFAKNLFIELGLILTIVSFIAAALACPPGAALIIIITIQATFAVAFTLQLAYKLHTSIKLPPASNDNPAPEGNPAPVSNTDSVEDSTVVNSDTFAEV
ncbi:hypothetical protein [Chlamydia sp.]|uniref:hypothetical protein n=1 Tax=Chlamydia sp. TaxID=35827 RepID=UPI0025C43ADC|nr:hypothetical protein [Chlamydia sp.]MBQ8499031.1 hypothetical protein [Chlamydia sp.]